MAMDFTKMAYFIEDVPESDSVIEKFPDLMAKADVFAKDDDLPEGVDADKVLRYLIYMFSPGTPLREIHDFKLRKQFALRKLNIEADEDGDLPDGYGEMCLVRQDFIIERFVTFTKFFRAVAYEKLAFAEQRNAQLARAILKSSIDKSADDKNFRAGRQGWYDDIDAALKEIMDGETSKRLEEAIGFKVKMDALGISSEEYALFYKENGTVFPEIIP